VVTVQRRFRIEIGRKTPTKVPGYKLLNHAGSNCKRINASKCPVTEAEVNELEATFVCSTKKDKTSCQTINHGTNDSEHNYAIPLEI
jgi:hypothetical protein